MGKQMTLKEFKEILPMLKDDTLVTIDKRESDVDKLLNTLNEYLMILVDMSENYLLPNDAEIRISDNIKILCLKVTRLEETISLKSNEIFNDVEIKDLKDLSEELYLLTRNNRITDLCRQIIDLLNMKGDE